MTKSHLGVESSSVQLEPAAVADDRGRSNHRALFREEIGVINT